MDDDEQQLVVLRALRAWLLQGQQLLDVQVAGVVTAGSVTMVLPRSAIVSYYRAIEFKTFRTEAAFESWMRQNHAREDEVWVRLYKKGSGVPSITLAEALDVVLCWGWIDGIRKGLDERSYLQRYTPRRAKSIWSQINREHVARLTKAGRMTRHGQRQVDAAKADGRWDAAYASMRALNDNFPSDLRKAIEASPRARKTFQSLGRQNLYALAFRTTSMKTAAGREENRRTGRHAGAR